MKTIRIGLAPLRQPDSVLHGVEKIDGVLAASAAEQVAIVCFPEAYLPGLRGASFDLPAVDQTTMEEALKRLRASCRARGVAAIVGLEWVSELGLENRGCSNLRRRARARPPDEEPDYAGRRIAELRAGRQTAGLPYRGHSLRHYYLP